MKIETIEIHANFTITIHTVVRLILDDFIDESGYCAQHGKEGRNHLPRIVSIHSTVERQILIVILNSVEFNPIQ